MKVITEAVLRAQLQGKDLAATKEYRVADGVVVAPSARAWLAENNIPLYIGGCLIAPNTPPASETEAAKGAPSASLSPLPPFETPARYESICGKVYETKPEHMTALYGNTLVCKDHKHIRLRGVLDSLTAQLLLAQLAFGRLCLAKGVSELEEVLACVKDLLRYEVLQQPLAPLLLFGMDEAEIHSRSHLPQNYYGIGHFSPSRKDGEAVLLLNSLRTAMREAELAAYEALKQENGEPEQPELLQALNRLSSALYIMMFKAKTGEYAP